MPLGAARFGLLGVADLGKLELIATQTYSGAVGFVDFKTSDGTFDTSYNVHFLTFNDIGSTISSSTKIQFYESGVLETASVYQYARQVGTVGGTFIEQKSTASGDIPLAGSYSSSANYKGNGYVYFYNLGDSSKYSFCSSQDFTMDIFNNGTMTFMSAVLPQASTVDGFRITLSSGTFTSFDISLYGIAES